MYLFFFLKNDEGMFNVQLLYTSLPFGNKNILKMIKRNCEELSLWKVKQDIDVTVLVRKQFMLIICLQVCVISFLKNFLAPNLV